MLTVCAASVFVSDLALCLICAATASAWPQVSWSSVLVPQESRQGRLMFAYSVKFTMLTPEQQQQTLLQLAAEEQAWQQQQQIGDAPAGGANDVKMMSLQQLDGQAVDSVPAGPSLQAEGPNSSAAGAATAAAAAEAAAAAAGRGSSSTAVAMQSIILGPCTASAGPAAVPAALAAAAPWAAAAAAAAAGPATRRGSSSGANLAAAAAAAGSQGNLTGASSSRGASSDYDTPQAAAAAADASEAAPSSCQLESRHWVILNPQGSRVDSVDGEGVVGLYPLLRPGNEPFADTSCTPCPIPAEIAREAASTTASWTAVAGAEPTAAAAAAAAAGSSSQGLGQSSGQGLEGGGLSSSRWQTGPGRLAGSVVGAMEGSFSFVEGSLMQRSGGAFSVACPRLVFAVPEYIF